MDVQDLITKCVMLDNSRTRAAAVVDALEFLKWEHRALDALAQLVSIEDGRASLRGVDREDLGVLLTVLNVGVRDRIDAAIKLANKALDAAEDEE